METFRKAGPLISNRDYQRDRQESLLSLRDEIEKGSIDLPVLALLRDFSTIPHCYSLQCCFGHFVHEKEPDNHNLAPLAPYIGSIRCVRYRIAYLALCIENSGPGRELIRDLDQITDVAPDCIQFGCADWFREKVKNSYILQVEPERFKTQDSAEIDMDEALHVEKVRNWFFEEIARVTGKHRDMPGKENS